MEQIQTYCIFPDAGNEERAPEKQCNLVLMEKLEAWENDARQMDRPDALLADSTAWGRAGLL
jgi:hypothetical protein